MPKIKRKIRQEVSQITDVLIPENRWEHYIDLMDRENKFTRKNLISIVMLMCQELEQFENLIEDLYFQVELLQGHNPQMPLPKEFKIRTKINIYKDLEALNAEGVKAFYVSRKDWDILEKSVDPALSKEKPEHGFGKEVNPKTGLEETCLYYNDLPIFRSN